MVSNTCESDPNFAVGVERSVVYVNQMISHELVRSNTCEMGVLGCHRVKLGVREMGVNINSQNYLIPHQFYMNGWDDVKIYNVTYPSHPSSVAHITLHHGWNS